MGWELKDTKDLMCSNNYKDRFVAEYMQTKIRYEKLKHFCNQIEAAKAIAEPVFEPRHDCPYEILREQQGVMGNYLHILEVRAIIENINIGQGQGSERKEGE